MTLLLKSVWRNVLKSSSINNSTLKSRSLSNTLAPPGSAPETSRGKSADSVMMTLKSAPSAADILAAVQRHLPAMTHVHMLQAFRSLFELHKAGKFERSPEDLVKDPAFGVLCQNFKKHARALEVKEAIEATKVLSYLGVPVSSLIVQTMLQLIRCNINLLGVRQIMFLDFILHRFDEKNHLVDALKLALPLAFQIHLPMELDHEDLPLLKDMLAYCCTHDLPDRCVNNVVTALLLHDQAINAPCAKSIIWSLCQINCTQDRHPTRAQLLHICCDILCHCIEDLSYDDVLRTAARIKGRILEKHPEYYHENLMDAIAGYVVKNNVDFEKGLLVARILSRIAHTNLGLVEYLCKKALEPTYSLANARTNILFSFVNCLSNNNYTPEGEDWDKLRQQISANPVLDTQTTALPWSKFCVELASLGHYDDKLLKRVFSKTFLDEFLNNKEDNTLDYLQLLTLQEAVNAFYSTEYALPDDILQKARSVYPTHAITDTVLTFLASGLGSEDCALKNVVLPSGIIADVFLCMDRGYPVRFPREILAVERVRYEDLELPAAGVPVCVLAFTQGCFSMNSNRLRGTFRLVVDVVERRGLAALALHAADWLAAPTHARAPLLMRDLASKCGEMGVKLTAVLTPAS